MCHKINMNYIFVGILNATQKYKIGKYEGGGSRTFINSEKKLMQLSSINKMHIEYLHYYSNLIAELLENNVIFVEGERYYV